MAAAILYQVARHKPKYQNQDPKAGLPRRFTPRKDGLKPDCHVEEFTLLAKRGAGLLSLPQGRNDMRWKRIHFRKVYHL
jgi:hypothetical protein